MHYYFSAPIWDDEQCPNTEPKAQPTKWEDVTKITVIEVVNATYRGSKFSGKFAIDDSKPIAKSNDGLDVAIIYCLWFGHRLKTRGIKVKFHSNNVTLIKDFSGRVISNLSL